MVQSISAGVTCPCCGKDELYLGKLPAVGAYTAVHVFKCETCMTVRSTPVGMAEPVVPSPGGRAAFR
jgi:hypothetical protein